MSTFGLMIRKFCYGFSYFGSITVKVVGWFVKAILPLCCSIIFLHVFKPSSVPLISGVISFLYSDATSVPSDAHMPAYRIDLSNSRTLLHLIASCVNFNSEFILSCELALSLVCGSVLRLDSLCCLFMFYAIPPFAVGFIISFRRLLSLIRFMLKNKIKM